MDITNIPYSTREVERILDRTTVTLWRWRRDGHGPDWVEHGGRIYYDKTSVHEWRDRLAAERAA